MTYMPTKTPRRESHAYQAQLHALNVQLIRDIGYRADDVIDPNAPLKILFDADGLPTFAEFQVIGRREGAHAFAGDLSTGRTVSIMQVPIGEERANRYLRDVKRLFDLPDTRPLRPRPNLDRLDRVRELWVGNPLVRSVVARVSPELHGGLNELLGYESHG